MDSGAVFFFIIVALFIGVVLVIAAVFDRRRTEALSAIATDLGFSFYEKGNDQPLLASEHRTDPENQRE